MVFSFRQTCFPEIGREAGLVVRSVRRLLDPELDVGQNIRKVSPIAAARPNKSFTEVGNPIFCGPNTRMQSYDIVLKENLRIASGINS